MKKINFQTNEKDQVDRASFCDTINEILSSSGSLLYIMPEDDSIKASIRITNRADAFVEHATIRLNELGRDFLIGFTRLAADDRELEVDFNNTGQVFWAVRENGRHLFTDISE